MDGAGKCNCNPPYKQYVNEGPCSIDCGQGFINANGTCICHPGYTTGPDGRCIANLNYKARDINDFFEQLAFNRRLMDSGVGG